MASLPPKLVAAVTKEERDKVLAEEEAYLKEQCKKNEELNDEEYPFEEKRLPLAEADVAKIKKQQRNLLMAFPIILAGVIWLCLKLIDEGIDPQGYSWLFALLILLFGIYFYFQLSGMAKKGKKIITGVITKRDYTMSPKSETVDNWYFAISEKTEVDATEVDYWTYRIGDTVEVEVVPTTFTVNNKFRLIERAIGS